MNTAVLNVSSDSFISSSGPSRRDSTESIYSVQGKETDVIQDTSDTETFCDDDLEYEPVTDFETETQPPLAVLEASSDQTENEIIRTKIIEVTADETDEELADAEEEQISADTLDCDIRILGFGRCAECGVRSNPLYRLCGNCFKVRKSFFPPRPKRKKRKGSGSVPRALSQDSGLGSVVNGSQDLSQPSTSQTYTPCSQNTPLSQSIFTSQEIDTEQEIDTSVTSKTHLKRRSGSVDRQNKRMKIDYSDISESDNDQSLDKIVPLIKTVSAPTISLETEDNDNIKSFPDGGKVKSLNNNNDNVCMVCVTEPKSGVFVHGRIAHICCCYKCAMKVWVKTKRCPICNRRVSNVVKAIVM